MKNFWTVYGVWWFSYLHIFGICVDIWRHLDVNICHLKIFFWAWRHRKCPHLTLRCPFWHNLSAASVTKSRPRPKMIIQSHFAVTQWNLLNIIIKLTPTLSAWPPYGFDFVRNPISRSAIWFFVFIHKLIFTAFYRERREYLTPTA